MLYSEFVTGRVRNKKAWNKAFSDVVNHSDGCMVVGCFETRDGRKMYADAKYCGTREAYAGCLPGETRCNYRVIVTPKSNARQCREPFGMNS